MFQVTTDLREELDVQFLAFSGGERHVQLPAIQRLPVRKVFIIARINSAAAMMDALLLVNALRQALGQDLAVDLELPYLPYSRQDRVCAAGQAFSLEVFSQLLTLLRLNKLTTWDCHSEAGLAMTHAQNLPPEDIIQQSSDLCAILQDVNSVVICPDKGALSRSSRIAKHFNQPALIRCEKRRDPSTGRILFSEVLADDLSGKTAVITDDICDGGFTFIKIAEQLKAKGADRIILYVTHGLFSKGLGVFDGLIDEIYTSNSIAHQATDQRLNIISVR